LSSLNELRILVRKNTFQHFVHNSDTTITLNECNFASSLIQNSFIQHSTLVMKTINWALAILIAFNLLACTSGTDNTTKHEVVTKTTKQSTAEVRTITTEAITKTAENTNNTQVLADAKMQTGEAGIKTKKDAPTKLEKTNAPKPKQVAIKVKESVKAETEKVIEKTQEAIKTTTAAVTEAPPKAVEMIKTEATPPPPPPKPETLKTTPPVAEKPTLPPPTSETKPTPKPELPLSHEVWNTLLGKHVSSTGTVNYDGFKADKAQMQDYLDLLANNAPQADWEREKTMAYWINAYNAFTVKLIVDNYPLSSITDLEGGKPWSKRWIKLGDQTYSLDQIEKEILLKKYKDARIHFAVNCAAKSCPALLNQAWTAANLESNFERQTKKFINNSQFNEISPKSAKVSQLFDWYAADFGDVRTFINKYSNTQLKSNAEIDFMEYNWKLNE